MINTIQHPNGVREIQMARPPANAMNAELLHALLAALKVALADETKVIVLSSDNPKIFSGGLDVPALVTYKEADLLAFFELFFEVARTLSHSSKPIAAAITGHSPAGGAVFATACDYRVMAAGNSRIGLNEVEVALVVPKGTIAQLQRLVGVRMAERLTVEAQMITADEAYRVGWVDAAVPAEEVIPHAIAWAQKIAAFPPNALRKTRALARADAMTAYDDAVDMGAVMREIWQSPETQQTMMAFVMKLQKK